MRTEKKLLRAALRVLRISRPADPRHCKAFDRAREALERWFRGVNIGRAK